MGEKPLIRFEFELERENDLLGKGYFQKDEELAREERKSPHPEHAYIHGRVFFRDAVLFVRNNAQEVVLGVSVAIERELSHSAKQRFSGLDFTLAEEVQEKSFLRIVEYNRYQRQWTDVYLSRKPDRSKPEVPEVS